MSAFLLFLTTIGGAVVLGLVAAGVTHVLSLLLEVEHVEAPPLYDDDFLHE